MIIIRYSNIHSTLDVMVITLYLYSNQFILLYIFLNKFKDSRKISDIIMEYNYCKITIYCSKKMWVYLNRKLCCMIMILKKILHNLIHHYLNIEAINFNYLDGVIYNYKWGKVHSK